MLGQHMKVSEYTRHYYYSVIHQVGPQQSQDSKQGSPALCPNSLARAGAAVRILGDQGSEYRNLQLPTWRSVRSVNHAGPMEKERELGLLEPPVTIQLQIPVDIFSHVFNCSEETRIITKSMKSTLVQDENYIQSTSDFSFLPGMDFPGGNYSTPFI